MTGRVRRHLPALVGIATVLALLAGIGLFARAYQHAGAPAPDAAGSGGPAPAGSAPATPAHPALDGTVPPGGPGVDPVLARALPERTFTAPGGPGFTIVPAARYTLVLTATSAEPIGTVGYLVPTSPRDNYGKAEHVGRHWRMSTTVTGKPYYAAIFVQAGKAGTPITCTIRLGGKVISSASTKGGYGQQVCYG